MRHCRLVFRSLSPETSNLIKMNYLAAIICFVVVVVVAIIVAILSPSDDTMKVSVTTRDGSKTFTLDVKPSDSIQNVKSKIQASINNFIGPTNGL